MFGDSIDGPTSVFCNNEAVYKTTILLESTLINKYHLISYRWCREAVSVQTKQVTREDTPIRSAD